MQSSTRFLAAASLAVAFVLPAAAFAQTAPAPLASPMPGMHGHHGHHGSAYMRALHALNLSDAQKAQIKTAMQQSHQAGQNADPATRKADREKLRAQIDGILTPDQRTQLHTAMQQQRATHTHTHTRTRGGVPNPTASTKP
jgi:Spy/CpxP family protein refolding chaperone